VGFDFWHGKEIFVLSKTPRPVVGHNRLALQCVLDAPSLRVKRPGFEVHRLPSGAEGTNVWSYKYTLPYSFVVCLPLYSYLFIYLLICLQFL
jgi:hypothetical protein